jgi:hypothetical protein
MCKITISPLAILECTLIVCHACRVKLNVKIKIKQPIDLGTDAVKARSLGCRTAFSHFVARTTTVFPPNIVVVANLDGHVMAGQLLGYEHSQVASLAGRFAVLRSQHFLAGRLLA